MDLKDFVKKVLIEVNEAVDEAAAKTSREVHFTEGKNARTIEFDIAVSADNGTAGSGKAGVKVLNVIDAGGEIKKEVKNSTVSRVQFGLTIDYMTKTERENDRNTSSVYSAGSDETWPSSF